MESPVYLVVRDNDLARLEASVNDRIDEGYTLAGHLFAVTPAQGGVLYVQPLVLEMEEFEDEEDDADDADDAEDEDAEEADEDAARGQPAAPARRPRR